MTASLNSRVFDFVQQAEADDLAAKPLLERALAEFPRGLKLAMSFSAEDVVVLKQLCDLTQKPLLFSLDTGRLPEETYSFAEEIADYFDISIEWVFPERTSVEELLRTKGARSFRQSVDNRIECCFIRKVEPLGRVLSSSEGWITGLRREHSGHRSGLPKVEVDRRANRALLKLNPIAEWSWSDVEEFISSNGLPKHPLYEQGYGSIGCAPCSRPLKPGEHVRAGRWWWEAESHKECGLHLDHAGTVERE